MQLGGVGTQPTICLPPSAELSLFLFNDPSFEFEGIGYRNLGTLTGSPQVGSAGSLSPSLFRTPARRGADRGVILNPRSTAGIGEYPNVPDV